ncbi:MAG: hypothetical protein KDE14_10540 [Rhodobacteraceae bacterium]|nr:hypothetical protein [Paracoccaceae bacterium]
MKTIRVELARTKDHPEGNPGHVYEFRAPLDAEGHLDADAWPKVKQLCTVRRLENGTEQEKGLLIRTKGGKWVFSYEPGDDDDEAIFKFSTHVFKPGEYVSITEHDGEQRTFRITSVADWHPPAS